MNFENRLLWWSVEAGRMTDEINGKIKEGTERDA
jgi:hypothetical protein